MDPNFNLPSRTPSRYLPRDRRRAQRSSISVTQQQRTSRPFGDFFRTSVLVIGVADMMISLLEVTLAAIFVVAYFSQTEDALAAEFDGPDLDERPISFALFSLAAMLLGFVKMTLAVLLIDSTKQNTRVSEAMVEAEYWRNFKALLLVIEVLWSGGTIFFQPLSVIWLIVRLVCLGVVHIYLKELKEIVVADVEGNEVEGEVDGGRPLMMKAWGRVMDWGVLLTDY